MEPKRRCYYFGLASAIQDIFTQWQWVEGRGAAREEWKKDPSHFAGSPAWQEINKKVEGALDDKNTIGFSLAYDFVNIFQVNDYSVGVILARSEDHDLETRSKRRFHKVVMLVPGPNLPRSLDGYFQLIAREFRRLGPACIGGEGLKVTPVEIDVEAEAAAAAGLAPKVAFRDGPRILKQGKSFTLRIVLLFLYADAPARTKLLKCMGSAAAYLACHYCWLTGERLDANGETDLQHGRMFFLGYCELVEPICGWRATDYEVVEDESGDTSRNATKKRKVKEGFALTMDVDDPKRRVENWEQKMREDMIEEPIAEGTVIKLLKNFLLLLAPRADACR